MGFEVSRWAPEQMYLFFRFALTSRKRPQRRHTPLRCQAFVPEEWRVSCPAGLFQINPQSSCDMGSCGFPCISVPTIRRPKMCKELLRLGSRVLPLHRPALSSRAFRIFSRGQAPSLLVVSDGRISQRCMGAEALERRRQLEQEGVEAGKLGAFTRLGSKPMGSHFGW